MTAIHSQYTQTGADKGQARDMGMREFVSDSAEETRKLGFAIGAAALPGDIVCLIGDLGAGKTTLTQGIGQGLGLSESEITSPTFMLLAEHSTGRIPLYHFDVYRLTGPADLHELAFDDYLTNQDGLIVIEWANIVLDALPADVLVIQLAHVSEIEQRRIHIAAIGSASMRLFEAIS